MTRDRRVEFCPGIRKLFVILKGGIDLITCNGELFTIGSKEMFFFDSGQCAVITARQDTTMLIFRLKNFSGFSSYYPTEQLVLLKDVLANTPKPAKTLYMRGVVNHNIELIDKYLDYGLADNRLFQIKTKELLLNLGKEYSLLELYGFFEETVVSPAVIRKRE